MGNRWSEKEGIFHGYVVEDYLCSWGAVPSGEGSASEGKVGCANLPGGSDQPQGGLQVVEAVYGSGPAWGGSSSEGKVGCANLPGGSAQPQDGLQVVEAVYGSGPGRAAGPVATTAASAATNAKEVGRADSAVAASAAALGSQEAAGGAAAPLGRRGAKRSNDGAVAAAVG